MTILAAVKTADTSRSLTETETIDPHLQVSVAASENYTFKAMLFVGHAGAGGGEMRIQMIFPTGTGGDIAWIGSGGATYITPTASSSVFFDIPTSTVGQYLFGQGTIDTGGNSGTLGIGWAQSNSNANATIMKQYSWMKLTLL